MATAMFLQSLPVAISSLYLEQNILPKYLQAFSEAGNLLSLPKAYGGVILVNIIASGLYLVVLGMKVGGARKKFTDKVPLPFLSFSFLGRQSKMAKKMLKSVILFLIYMLKVAQRMLVCLIVFKEDTNRLLKPTHNS
jgi:hypothetical protein